LRLERSPSTIVAGDAKSYNETADLLYLGAIDPSRFKSESFGRVVRTRGKTGFYTFVPTPIPRSLSLASRTVSLLSEADRALGRLAGAGRLLPNPQLLVNAYITREAVASSRIEGTQATISDVFDAESRGDVRGDVREVVNYIDAMSHGLRRLDALPISKRLVEEIHRVLLTGVRGEERNPGEVRRSPNWIGSPDNRPETAVFVPPPVDEMSEGLSDWEHFVNDETLELPPLISCALMHYQFETLHPFLDGNGRVGRLLIVFYLVGRGHLPAPLLYLSSYFELHKSTYYDSLQGVREGGDLDGWLQFFLAAVASQATDAERRAEQILDLREQYRVALRGDRSRAGEVLDLLIGNPFVTTRSVSSSLDITIQGATKLLNRLEAANVITPAPRIPGRSKRWVCRGILETLI
jgi:Fic family protein